MSIFEKCFKSWFDTVRWWGMSCAFEIFQIYWFRCFLRRVMVILRQQKNFGPNVRYCVLDIMKNNCSCIVSFVVKSPSGGKNPWKTAPANPRRSFFEKCFKSWFDIVRWWKMSCAFDFLRNYWFRCFLRRVMVFVSKRNSVPMSYISLWEHLLISFDFCRAAGIKDAFNDRGGIKDVF